MPEASAGPQASVGGRGSDGGGRDVWSHSISEYLQEMGLPLPQGQPGGSPEGGEAPSRTPRPALHHPGFTEQYPLQGTFNKIFHYLFICGCSGSLLLHTGFLELQ